MKRLSLVELKAVKEVDVVKNLETVKGGDVDMCHVIEVLKNIEDFLLH